MKYLERIKAAFEASLGGAVAASLTPESTMETLEGWDSTSFIGLVLSVEDEFDVKLSTLDAASLTSIKAIDDYLQRKLG